MDKVLLVIPAYNEEKNIERVVDQLTESFPELDYIVVNDGSKDRTAEICRKRGYRLLDLPVNLGRNTPGKRATAMRSSLTETGSTVRNLLKP